MSSTLLERQKARRERTEALPPSEGTDKALAYAHALDATETVLRNSLAFLERMEFSLEGNFCPVCRTYRQRTHDPAVCPLREQIVALREFIK